MLTTTIDGLWVLQVLSGLEVVAPELGLRPHLPSVENPRMALQHPVASELQRSGVISDTGAVDEHVLEWLTVLSRRDVALVMYRQTPTTAADPERLLLSRFAQWWVALERHGTMVRLSGAGTATSEQTAGRLINTQIQRLCGELHPAPIRPVTIDATELLGAVTDRSSLRDFLALQKIDPVQRRILNDAADPARTVQTSILALQSDCRDVDATTVTVMDTPAGRVMSEQLRHDGKTWMIVGPGSSGHIASAVQRMVRRLPATDNWYSHRKVV